MTDNTLYLIILGVFLGSIASFLLKSLKHSAEYRNIMDSLYRYLIKKLSKRRRNLGSDNYKYYKTYRS